MGDHTRFSAGGFTRRRYLAGVIRVFLVAGVCGLLLTGAAGSAPILAAQNGLPDGPGRDVTVKVCGNCHAAEAAASVRLTPDGWRDLIARMVAAGAQGTEPEMKTVFEYLSTHFPAQEQTTLDLNTAAAIDLESVAGLLRKEAAALIAYREKNGPCKKLEDLKKVEGLDYKKIEARKDRLACR
jgi:competence protein ComEA